MLDGGHLLLNFVEFINRGPLKRKYLELAHTFGFIRFNFTNDICNL